MNVPIGNNRGLPPSNFGPPNKRALPAPLPAPPQRQDGGHLIVPSATGEELELHGLSGHNPDVRDQVHAEYKKHGSPINWLYGVLRDKINLDINTPAGREQIRSIECTIDPNPIRYKDAQGAAFLAKKVTYQITLQNGDVFIPNPPSRTILTSISCWNNRTPIESQTKKKQDLNKLVLNHTNFVQSLFMPSGEKKKELEQLIGQVAVGKAFDRKLVGKELAVVTAKGQEKRVALKLPEASMAIAIRVNRSGGKVIYGAAIPERDWETTSLTTVGTAKEQMLNDLGTLQDPYGEVQDRESDARIMHNAGRSEFTYLFDSLGPDQKTDHYLYSLRDYLNLHNEIKTTLEGFTAPKKGWLAAIARFFGIHLKEYKEKELSTPGEKMAYSQRMATLDDQLTRLERLHSQLTQMKRNGDVQRGIAKIPKGDKLLKTVVKEAEELVIKDKKLFELQKNANEINKHFAKKLKMNLRDALSKERAKPAAALPLRITSPPKTDKPPPTLPAPLPPAAKSNPPNAFTLPPAGSKVPPRPASPPPPPPSNDEIPPPPPPSLPPGVDPMKLDVAKSVNIPLPANLLNDLHQSVVGIRATLNRAWNEYEKSGSTNWGAVLNLMSQLIDLSDNELKRTRDALTARVAQVPGIALRIQNALIEKGYNPRAVQAYLNPPNNPKLRDERIFAHTGLRDEGEFSELTADVRSMRMAISTSILDRTLAEYTPKENPGGGDCLFFSCNDVVANSKIRGMAAGMENWRAAIVKELQEHREIYQPFLNYRLTDPEDKFRIYRDKNWSTYSRLNETQQYEYYCNWISRRTTWGADPEVQAFSRLTRRPLIMLQDYGLGTPEIAGLINGEFKGDPLVILNHGAGHFVAMIK